MHTFRHSGKLGDIIYSLAAVRAMGGGRYLVDARRALASKPALGEQAAYEVCQLVALQSYVQEARVRAKDEPFTVDLDTFRLAGPRLNTAHLAQSHWEAVGGATEIDLSRPWITVPAPLAVAPIVVGRTSQFGGDLQSWTALSAHRERSVFVGFESEWHEFRKVDRIRFHRVSGIVELARVIAGAAMFVGNQSLAFALAEALKVPRVLEVCPWIPNCTPQSDTGHTELTEGIIERYLAAASVGPRERQNPGCPTAAANVVTDTDAR